MKIVREQIVLKGDVEIETSRFPSGDILIEMYNVNYECGMSMVLTSKEWDQLRLGEPGDMKGYDHP